MLSQLTIAAAMDDYEMAVKVATDVLAAEPANSHAARQKAVALIKLDRYKEALSFLDEATFLNSQDVVLERGFCLYKLGRGKEAAEVLKMGSGRAVSHVQAQNAYRMENFTTSIRIYEELAKTEGVVDHEAEDIASNISAARAQSTWTAGIGSGEHKTPVHEGYEVCFNHVYEFIALGKFSEAEEALLRAEKLCARSGLSGDELKAEQGIILAQLAFVKQLNDRKAEAAKLISDIQSQTSVDAFTRAITMNNQLVLEPNENPFENLRILSAAAHSFTASKPFLAQLRPFNANMALVESSAKKADKKQKLDALDCAASTSRLYRELDGATDVLAKLSSIFHRDENNVSAGLLLVQLHTQAGNRQEAAATLERLFHASKDLEVKYAPGLVSLAVLLLPEERSTPLLLDAKTYWAKQTSGVQMMSLRNHATLARLDQLLSLQPSDAHTKEIELMITEQKARLEQYDSDVSTQAVLAALYSTTSHPPPQSPLPPISSFTKAINVNRLETQGIPSSASALVAKKPKIVSRPRKRRVRGGKVFDSSRPVDPERWLPLRERSYYKPSKSKRRKTGGGAAQGSAVEGESMSRNGSSHQVEAKKGDVGGGKKKKKGRK